MALCEVVKEKFMRFIYYVLMFINLLVAYLLFFSEMAGAEECTKKFHTISQGNVLEDPRNQVSSLKL